MTKFSKLKILFLLSAFYFLFSFRVNAAQLNLTSQTQEIGVSQQFQADLMLDAENEDINAIEGKVIFPATLLELKEIRDGDSIISFWVEKPNQKEAGEIKFSGIVPGGFRGVLGPYWQRYKPGKVFSLIFTAKKEGEGAIEIHGVKVLLNNGEGMPVDLKISNFQFLISKQVPSSKFQVPSSKDTDPPELFTPEVSRDLNIFNGRWFLVFAAQDKVSGIDHYEIQETRKKEPDKNKWNVVESPALLKDQSRSSYIFVKAIDRAGNERVVVVMPEFRPWYRKPIVDMILTLVALVMLILIVKWLRRKIIHE